MFAFRLLYEDGRQAEPERFVTAVPGWRVGDPIFVSPVVKYRVVELREEDVLVVVRE